MARGNALKNLAVGISARVTGFVRGIKKARASLRRFSRDIPLANTHIARLAAAGTVAAAGGLAYLIKRTADAGDRLDKMGKRTGLAVDFLSELDHAAGLSGTSLEDIEKGVKKLSKSALDAGNGLATYKRDFDTLGVSVKDAAGNLKEPRVLFDEVTTALAGLENHTQKAAIAQNLFGRTGTMLLPMLTQGKAGLKAMREEARRLGFIWDDETAAAAAELNDNIARVTYAVGSMATQFAVDLIPTVNQGVMAVVEFAKANRELISTKVVEWAGATAEAIRGAFNVVARWSQDRRFELWFERAKAAFLGFKLVGVTAWEGIKGGFELFVAGWKAQIGLVVAVWDKAIGNIRRVWGTFLKTIGEGMVHLKGMDKVGQDLIVAGSRQFAEGSAQSEGAFTRNKWFEEAAVNMDAAADSGDRIKAAFDEYVAQAEKVAGLSMAVEDNMTRTLPEFFEKAATAAGEAVADATKAKAESPTIGGLKQLNTRDISVAGLALQGGNKKQKVEDPKAQEYLKRILEQLKRNKGGDAQAVYA